MERTLCRKSKIEKFRCVQRNS